MSAVIAPVRPMATAVPRLGFLGVGWIGRHRMQCVADSGAGVVAAVCDPDTRCVDAALQDQAGASAEASLESLLARDDLDGIVIATPSAAHADQAIAALERGLPVFCQKPLARTAVEAAAVVDAARRADRLLGVDFSYRHVRGMREVREAVRTGELGELYAIDLTFHNAYGPDKPWFRDVALSGGGCVMDLGVHLIDLALWLTDGPPVHDVDARLSAGGRRLSTPIAEVEDYAAVQMRLGEGTHLRMTTSWNLPAGRDAEIAVALYGTRGGAALRNVDGSFYDFTVDRFRGTACERIAQPPDAWGGRALIEWTRALARDRGFDEEIAAAVEVAAVVDRIYGRASAGHGERDVD